MKRLRLILTVAAICIMTAAIGAAPVTKRPTATRVASPTQTAPGSGSDVVKEPSRPTTTTDQESMPSNGTLLETELDFPVSEVPAVTIPSASGTTAAPINMDWYSINNGGAIEVAAGNIKMGLSVGQNAVGEVTAGNIKMGLGFWYGATGSGAPTCDCDCHGDPQCDGVTNVFDVTHAVNIAFRGADAILDPNILCTLQTTDVDCNGVTSIFDVTRFVNVAFRGGDPNVEFCSPCAPNL